MPFCCKNKLKTAILDLLEMFKYFFIKIVYDSGRLYIFAS